MLFHTVHPVNDEQENSYENGRDRKKIKNEYNDMFGREVQRMKSERAELQVNGRGPKMG
jgi:hypothetical protein